MNRLKNIEVIPVAEMASENLSCDIEKFKAFSRSFNDSYVTGFNNQIEELRSQINPPELSRKLIDLKKQFFDTLQEIKLKLVTIEDMCLLYKNRLVVPRGHFKIYEVRREVRKRNVTGIHSGLEATFVAIRKSMPHLEGVGFNNLLVDELDGLRKRLLTVKKEKEVLEAKQKELFAANQDKILQLQSSVSQINKYGKLIFGKVDEERRKHYTLAYTLDKVRDEERKLLKSADLV